jgi:hypothetical protein
MKAHGITRIQAYGMAFERGSTLGINGTESEAVGMAWREVFVPIGTRGMPSSLELSMAGTSLLDDTHPETGVLPARQNLRRSAHAELIWSF